MDVVRTRRWSIWRTVVAPSALVVALGAGAYAAVVLFEPHAAVPAIDRASFVTDVAARGDLVSAVRAPGTFVAERVRVADAPADGTVDALGVHVGSIVSAGTTIARLSDPDLDAALTDLGAQIVAARAELRSVEAESRAAELDRAAAAAAAVADYAQVREQAQRYGELHAQGLVSDYDAHVAHIKAGEARDAISFDRRKIVVGAADAAAKTAVAQARIVQLQAALAAKAAQRASLTIPAGASGVVASIAVERGQRVSAGTQIARIVDGRDLNVTLEVPEADMRGVVPGLPARIDVGSGTVSGHVSRIDPAAQNGVVAVDVRLDGSAPPNARPDLHVDGTIEIARLHDVVSIVRPVNAADGATRDLYRIAGGGNRAFKTRVRFGRGSPERIQVVSGIAPGTTVIVSDTSSFPDAPALTVR